MTYRSDLVYSNLRKQTSLTKRARNTQSPVFDLVIRGFRHCLGVLMPDNTILVRVGTLARIALNELRKARAIGDKKAIEAAEKSFDYYCDRLPRT